MCQGYKMFREMFLNSDPNCLNLLSCKDPSEDEFTRLKDVLLQFKNKKYIYKQTFAGIFPNYD